MAPAGGRRAWGRGRRGRGRVLAVINGRAGTWKGGREGRSVGLVGVLGAGGILLNPVTCTVGHDAHLPEGLKKAPVQSWMCNKK